MLTASSGDNFRQISSTATKSLLQPKFKTSEKLKVLGNWEPSVTTMCLRWGSLKNICIFYIYYSYIKTLYRIIKLTKTVLYIKVSIVLLYAVIWSGPSNHYMLISRTTWNSRGHPKLVLFRPENFHNIWSRAVGLNWNCSLLMFCVHDAELRS